jgi:hypothetical protein
MRDWREQAKHAAYLVLSMIVVADVALFAGAIVARHATNMSPLYFSSSSYALVSAPVDGYSAASTKIAVGFAPTRGWAVRYASQTCEYCRADEPQWSRLKSRLLENGYRIYVIPPNAQGAYPEGASAIFGTTQIPYVSVGWIKQYRLVGTPTTLLFNGSGKMIWAHLGEISRFDQESASVALEWNKIRAW